MNLNTILWILQTILCIKFISAAITHTFQQNKPTMQQAVQKMGSSARVVHPVSAAIMFLCSIGLVLPAVLISLAQVVPVSAAALAAMNLASIFLHLKFREKPMLFAGVILLVISAFVAYGRWVISPL